MTTITTSVVVVLAPLIGVYLVFLAVAHGVRDEQDSEIEVKLFPPTIRRRVRRVGRTRPESGGRHCRRRSYGLSALSVSGPHTRSPRVAKRRQGRRKTEKLSLRVRRAKRKPIP